MAVVKCRCGNYWNTQPAKANWVKRISSCRKCAPNGPTQLFTADKMTGFSAVDKAKAEHMLKKRPQRRVR